MSLWDPGALDEYLPNARDVLHACMQMDREREAAGQGLSRLLTLEEVPPFVFAAQGGGAKSGAGSDDSAVDARQQRRLLRNALAAQSEVPLQLWFVLLGRPCSAGSSRAASLAQISIWCCILLARQQLQLHGRRHPKRSCRPRQRRRAPARGPAGRGCPPSGAGSQRHRYAQVEIILQRGVRLASTADKGLCATAWGGMLARMTNLWPPFHCAAGG